jgi:hypothetical protein
MLRLLAINKNGFWQATYWYNTVMFLNSICPLEGQFSAGSKFQAFPPSNGVIFSSVFKRAMAPREISSVVQFSTSFSNVVFATSIILSAIPTCAPLICPRNATAIATTLVATAAAKRSRTILSHLWRHKRRNSGRWALSTHRMLSCITALDQPNDRIVSRPSTWQIKINCLW